MFDKLELFRMSSAMAIHAGRRQALVAENMANVDTPGFRAKRLPEFSDVVETRPGVIAQRATREGHLVGVPDRSFHAQITEVRNDPSPDGNTVSVETEMLESIHSQREHQRALAIYKSALKILHSTLARS